MHTQFGDGAIDGFPVAEVALVDGDDSSEDASPAAMVAEAVDPPSKVLGLKDLDHAASVSEWIRQVKRPARRYSLARRSGLP